MTENFKNDVYSLLAYIISSAVGCVSEPRLYGPMRLADTAGKMIHLLEEHDLLRTAGLNSIADRIETDKLLCMDDEQGFIQMLKDISGIMAEIINEEL